MKACALRNRIIEYATVQIREKGMSGVKVDEISSALRISKKTFYDVFESKSSMVRKCLLRVADEYKEKVGNLINDTSYRPVERLKVLLDSYINFLYLAETQSFHEFSRNSNFSDIKENMRKLWFDAFYITLCDCREYLLPEIRNLGFLNVYLGLFESSRTREDSRQKALNAAYVLSRGLFNDEGLKAFDNCYKTVM